MVVADSFEGYGSGENKVDVVVVPCVVAPTNVTVIMEFFAIPQAFGNVT